MTLLFAVPQNNMSRPAAAIRSPKLSSHRVVLLCNALKEIPNWHSFRTNVIGRPITLVRDGTQFAYANPVLYRVPGPVP